MDRNIFPIKELVSPSKNWFTYKSKTFLIPEKIGRWSVFWLEMKSPVSIYGHDFLSYKRDMNWGGYGVNIYMRLDIGTMVEPFGCGSYYIEVQYFQTAKHDIPSPVGNLITGKGKIESLDEFSGTMSRCEYLFLNELDHPIFNSGKSLASIDML